MFQRPFVWIVALAMLSAVHCSVTESTNIKTGGIWARYVIENDQGVIRAYAVLRVGGPLGTIVDLSGGEHLEVNGLRLTEWVEPVTGYHWSSRLMPEDPLGEYYFNFIRTDEEVGTLLHLPELPLVVAPEPAFLACFDLPIQVLWNDDVPGDGVSVSFSGDCVDGLTYNALPDSGEFELPGIPRAPGAVDGCALTITVTRMYAGAQNPVFQGGLVQQEARASVSVDLAWCD
jgi:hypothetical protein